MTRSSKLPSDSNRGLKLQLFNHRAYDMADVTSQLDHKSLSALRFLERCTLPFSHLVSTSTQ